jgi:hypothetical protein
MFRNNIFLPLLLMWHANTAVHAGSKTSKTSPTHALFLLLTLPCDLHVGPICKFISYLQRCREVLSLPHEGKNPFHPPGLGAQNPSRPWFDGACDWFRCRRLLTRAPTGHVTVPHWHAAAGTERNFSIQVIGCREEESSNGWHYYGSICVIRPV